MAIYSDDYPILEDYSLPGRGYTSIDGAAVEYILADGRATVSRIMTDDPDAHLDPRFAIGKDISRIIL